MLDAMKPALKAGKLEERNDSVDTYIKQAIGKEPVLSFSKAGDNPVQWIQLLQSLDYQDYPGWPLLSPPKVQMQKCDKCAREFCSTINYRRHVRVHRRALNIDKDFPKNRDLLGVYWDKLSLDEAEEILSLKNTSLENVPGLAIVEALTSLIFKTGFYSLPQVYVKAGSALLDVVQARPPRFPISSKELFSILDDASEKTFLCAGTALSMQKFVFDGEAGKIGLEMKNIIACTCFLVEQKLVNAWLDDRAAKALRCQKLLMEEEEAAEKRRAELLERKRLKKLRQKEQQRLKEQTGREEADLEETSSDSYTDLPSLETSSPPAVSDIHSYTVEEPLDLEPLRQLNTNVEVDVSCISGLDDVQFDTASRNTDSNNFDNVENRILKGNIRRTKIYARRPLSSSHREAANGFHSGVVHPKLGPVHRQGIHRDQKGTINNGHKIWTRKTKPGHEGADLKVLEELQDLNPPLLQNLRDQPDRDGTCEMLIGSISVTLRECTGQELDTMLTSPIDGCAIDNQSPPNGNLQEKLVKSDSNLCSTNPPAKLWRPVGRQEAASAATVKVGEMDREMIRNSKVVGDNSRIMNSSTRLESAESRGLKLFCSRTAEAFLTKRWKEALAADHVRLLVVSPQIEPVSPQIEPENHPDGQDDGTLSSVGLLEPESHGAPKMKSKAKSGNSRLKYLPKQRNQT